MKGGIKRKQREGRKDGWKRKDYVREVREEKERMIRVKKKNKEGEGGCKRKSNDGK